MGSECVGAGGVAPVVGEVEDGAVAYEFGSAEHEWDLVVGGGSPWVCAGQGLVDFALA